MVRMKTRPITLAALSLTSLLALALPAQAEDNERELKAKIEALPESGLLGTWMVGGRKVLVTDTTDLDDDDRKKFAVGQLVEVEGTWNGDVLVAKDIDLEDDKD